jgi:chaperone required for assembly of F1-ATPase
MADAANSMKRFYQTAATVPVDGGHGVRLDGRPVRTPGGAPLVVPNAALAQAIAEEWNRQGDRIDPRSMALTGLANAAIDRIAPNTAAFAAELARFGESDLLCYRADAPSTLVERQSERWDPPLAWARRRFDVDFELVEGVMHRPQPDSTIARLRKAVEAQGPFELAGFSPLVTISGSLVLALALAENAIDPGSAWDAATLDEQWQIEQWGEDAEALRALESRRAEFDAANRLLKML